MKLLIGSHDYINETIKELNCEIIKNKYGKPLDKRNKIFFNKSHCKDLSVAVIDDRECGIDIEKIKKYNDLIAKKICSTSEYEYLKKSKNKNYDYTTIWVLKESYLKCLGIGLSYSLKNISFVEENRIKAKIDNYSYEIKEYQNHLISIFRKDI